MALDGVRAEMLAACETVKMFVVEMGHVVISNLFIAASRCWSVILDTTMQPMIRYTPTWYHINSTNPFQATAETRHKR